ncbi:hypothetical protein MG293_000901 [Ovis ammon polii]|uniref:Uncharacterized protein n=1 Tax=Ovis ammon polii TaxID=230172 RepID=A0AAD4UM41_OVIAM|nr:hypothetical protein MG293_000901 [Ovis ammon polii]
MQEMWVHSQGQEDPLEKKMATTPVLLPGKSHGERKLADYSPWGRKRVTYNLPIKQQHQQREYVKVVHSPKNSKFCNDGEEIV